MTDDFTTGDVARFDQQIGELDRDLEALTAKYREIAAEHGELAAFTDILARLNEAALTPPAVVAAGAARRLARS